MAASLSDSYILGTNTKFQNRVQAALLTGAINISSEGTAVANHVPRLATVHAILANPTQLANFTNLFALSVATDVTVLSDATQTGTVALSAGNIDAQQALVTDAHINNAIGGQFNAYVQGIPA